MLVKEENGYSYLVLNITKNDISDFVKEFLNQSFISTIDLREFKVPNGNEMTFICYISCENSKVGREWIESYWNNK